MAFSETKLVLASGSPRRKELLSKLGFKFDVIAPELDESPLNGETPESHVLRLSKAKARVVAIQQPDNIVIGADTVVVLDNRILGKPSSPEEAVEMLSLLSGKLHTVYTGVSIIWLKKGLSGSDYDSTRVIFNDLDKKAILQYVASGEPLDKAGSYGIQGMGSFLVHHYEGEFDTVIGFPSKLFKRLFEEVVS